MQARDDCVIVVVGAGIQIGPCTFRVEKATGGQLVLSPVDAVLDHYEHQVATGTRKEPSRVAIYRPRNKKGA